MEMNLKPISLADVNVFDNSEYENLTLESRERLINDSINGLCKGKYFKFYLINVDNSCIGFINICGHSKSVVSIAPEIKKDYRKKGYAYSAMQKAIGLVRKLGYKIAIAGVKTDNIASQKLQEKLGFEYVQDFISKSGNLLKLYLKSL